MDLLRMSPSGHSHGKTQRTVCATQRTFARLVQNSEKRPEADLQETYIEVRLILFGDMLKATVAPMYLKFAAPWIADVQAA